MPRPRLFSLLIFQFYLVILILNQLVYLFLFLSQRIYLQQRAIHVDLNRKEGQEMGQLETLSISKQRTIIFYFSNIDDL